MKEYFKLGYIVSTVYYYNEASEETTCNSELISITTGKTLEDSNISNKKYGYLYETNEKIISNSCFGGPIYNDYYRINDSFKEIK